MPCPAPSKLQKVNHTKDPARGALVQEPPLPTTGVFDPGALPGALAGTRSLLETRFRRGVAEQKIVISLDLSAALVVEFELKKSVR